MSLGKLRVKGTNIWIIGTLERLSGCALASGFAQDGEPQYTGETDVWYDDQVTVQLDGKTLYVGNDLDTYTMDQLEWVPDAS